MYEKIGRELPIYNGKRYTAFLQKLAEIIDWEYNKRK